MEDAKASSTDLAALLEAWRAGDLVARDRAFVILGEHLERVARWLKSKNPVLSVYNQTGDIAQDALARLVDLFKDRVRIPGTVDHLLATATRVINGIAIDRVRKYKGPHGPVENEAGPPLEDVFVKPETAVADRLIRSEKCERTRSAVAQLPLIERQIILLDIEGLSRVEIANALKISEGQVRSRHLKAKRRLKVLLKDLGELTR